MAIKNDINKKIDDLIRKNLCKTYETSAKEGVYGLTIEGHPCKNCGVMPNNHEQVFDYITSSGINKIRKWLEQRQQWDDFYNWINKDVVRREKVDLGFNCYAVCEYFLEYCTINDFRSDYDGN